MYFIKLNIFFHFSLLFSVSLKYLQKKTLFLFNYILTFYMNFNVLISTLNLAQNNFRTYRGIELINVIYM